MRSRFPTVQTFDFCYKPVRISKNGIVMYVPCGKCNGCLLRKANTWSFRLGDEIENSSRSIFFTLTYNNHYVPKLKVSPDPDPENGMYHYYTFKDNYRFVCNGKPNVLREPLDFYSPDYFCFPLHNYKEHDYIGYLCKSDIQLWLKRLRKDIYENFNLSGGSLRYYIIGEYGPGKVDHKGKYRPHYHGIIFPCNEEVASFLLERGLFENWQMCDKTLFDDYTKFCDSGARHYVTEYVTGITYLPKVLRETKEIRPFRLSSKKNGAIGYGSQVRKKVFEDIERGIDTYVKRVQRIESDSLFFYPSSLINSLFPKCSRFVLLSFDGLLRVYEYLFNIREVGFDVASIFNEFCKFSLQDFTASLRCLQVCDLMKWTPYHYVEVLVDYYYRKDIRLLRYQYELQQRLIDNPYKCIGWYSNWYDFIFKDNEEITRSGQFFALSAFRHVDSVSMFLHSFGIYYDLDRSVIEKALDNSDYILEVDDILANADKSKKVNAVANLDPHIV